MVDDTMEITSIDGHDFEHGDIDIDLDLGGGQADEDYILEDAASNIGYEEGTHPQQSPAINDDLMLDDDNESFSMEDADLMNEEEQHIIAQESMSFALMDEGNSQPENDDHNQADPLADSTNYGTTDLYEQQDVYEPGLVEDEIQQVNTNESLNDEAAQVPGESLLQEDNQYSDPDPAEQETVEQETVEQEVAEEESEAPVAQEVLVPSSDPHSPLQKAPTEPTSSPTSVSIDVASPEAAANIDGPKVNSDRASRGSSVFDVMVMYRNVDYALFSTSELDDPDSFFLADRSIVEQPLTEFFKAVRAVIHQDLSDEDELCLSVESLGLETEEGSIMIEEVTLSQILRLHADLLSNDEAESMGPCYMLLSTRTSFSRRFSSLIAGAAQGKGLTELVAWNDQSPEQELSEDVDWDKQDSVSKDQNQAVDRVPEDHDDNQEPKNHNSEDTKADENQEHGGGSNSHTQPSTSLINEPDEQNPFLSKAQSDRVPATAPIAIQVTISGGSELVATSLPQASSLNGADVDEDGDLIDYSEDEAEDAAIQKPVVSATGQSDADETRRHNEYEEKNEAFRRRSLAQITTEDKLRSAGQSPAVADDEADGEQPNDNDAEYENVDGAEYDEYPSEHKDEQLEESYENDEQVGKHGDFTGDDVKANSEHDYGNLTGVDVLESATATQTYDDGSYEQFGTEEIQAREDIYDETGLDSYLENNLDYNDRETMLEDTSASHTSASLFDQTGKRDLFQEESKASPFEIVETAESSITIGDDEIQYDDDDLLGDVSQNVKDSAVLSTTERNLQSTEQTKDEIDYEDDEDEVKILQESTAGTKVLSNANGKRPIADVDSNDAQTAQIKDAKRPRS